MLNNQSEWEKNPDLLGAVGPIIPLLEDDDVTEIEILGFDKVYAKGAWRGHRLFPDIKWKSPQLLTAGLLSISEVVHRTISDEDPLFDGRLPGGERVNIVVAPCTPGDAYITIRKFPKTPMTLERLLGYGSLTPDVAEMLKGLIIMRKNIIVAGGTESGKTSLLNALSLLISREEKTITCEDARELQIQSPLVQSLETLKPWKPEIKAVTISNLVVNTLRMSPDRIIVGEVRDGAAMHLVRAFSTGHSGGMGTVHSDSAADALEMLGILCSMDEQIGANLTDATKRKIIAKAVGVVVYVEKMEMDNSRKITQIIEVERPRGYQVTQSGQVNFLYRTLCEFKFTGFGAINKYGYPTVDGKWIYPNCPSVVMKNSINAKNESPIAADHIIWPVESWDAPDHVNVD